MLICHHLIRSATQENKCPEQRTEIQCKSLSCIQLFVTPWAIQSMNSPGQNTGVGSLSLLQGIFPTRIKTRSPALQADSLPAEPQGKPKNTGVGSLSLLQWIFPTQELNQGLLHFRQIVYQLSYQGSPRRELGKQKSSA